MGYDHVIPELINRFFEIKKKMRIIYYLKIQIISVRAFCYIDDAINQILLFYIKVKSFKIINVGSFEEKKY